MIAGALAAGTGPQQSLLFMEHALTAAADNPGQRGKPAPINMGPLGSFFAIRKDGSLQEKEWGVPVKHATRIMVIAEV